MLLLKIFKLVTTILKKSKIKTFKKRHLDAKKKNHNKVLTFILLNVPENITSNR